MSKLAATKERVDRQLEIFFFHLEKFQFKLQMVNAPAHAKEIRELEKMMDIVNNVSSSFLRLSHPFYNT